MKIQKAKKSNKNKILPSPLRDQWLSLLEQDVLKFFPLNKRTHAVCPGCGSEKIDSEFSKIGFSFKWCKDCFSLYVSPRPVQSDLDTFYTKSKSTAFWSKSVFESTYEERRGHYIVPLANWMKSIIPEHTGSKSLAVLDFYPKFFSIWTENVSSFVQNINLITPVFLRKKPKGSKEVSISEIKKGSIDIITAFDVFDRVSNPREVMKNLSHLCKKGGLLFFTANTGSGLEYQVLEEHAKRLVPPDRLNLLTVEAYAALLKENGFEILDLATPGKPDVGIILEAFRNNPELGIPRFIRYMLEKRGIITQESFQDFLQLNNLSVYLRVVAKKK